MPGSPIKKRPPPTKQAGRRSSKEPDSSVSGFLIGKYGLPGALLVMIGFLFWNWEHPRVVKARASISRAIAPTAASPAAPSPERASPVASASPTPAAVLQRVRLDRFLFELYACRATGQGEVGCNFSIRNEGDDGEVYLYCSKATRVLAAGNEYYCSHLRLGNENTRQGYVGIKLLSDTYIKSSVQFSKVPSDLARFDAIELKTYYKGSVQLRDVPILR